MGRRSSRSKLSVVNFLLHHHLAARDLRRAEAAGGAMLPDVWRMADRRARVRGAARDGLQPAMQSVSDGLAHHLDVDAWFHRSPVFLRGEAAAREVLRGARGAA